MSDPLSIAITCPYPWPPGSDLAWEVAAQADALHRRGHRVTLLVPGTRNAAPDDGTDGPRVVLVGRAIKTGRTRSVAGPLELAAGLESQLASASFDVVHIHDPLAPYPALTALRHTNAAAIGWFHRPLSGAAFLGPLIERAVNRLDLRLADSAVVRRAANQVIPGDFLVVPPGAHDVPTPEEPGLAVVARGRDRAGMRFALAVARALVGELRGSVRLMGPPEAPWRTRAAVPKALRDHVEVVTDTGPDSWRALLGSAGSVLLATPEDVARPIARMAASSGRQLIAPRCDEALELREAPGVRLAAPFSRGEWIDATRQAMNAAPGPPGGAVGHDALAETLERLSLEAITARRAAAEDRLESVTVDFRLRVTPGMDPNQVAKACAQAGLDAVAVVSPGGLEPAQAVADAAPEDLSVIVGQEVRTADGVIVGLFLVESIPDGESLEMTARRIAEQGGMVVVPHPDSAEVPSADLLRDRSVLIDAVELVTAVGGQGSVDTARAAARLGLNVVAGTGSAGLEGVGAVAVRLRSFSDGRDCVAALRNARIVRPLPGRRARRGRHRAARST
ncbi:MAG: glycosyltransferase [Thermoleophilia bacterium]